MLATGDLRNALLPMTTGTSPLHKKKKKKSLKADGREDHQICSGQRPERIGFGADELGTLCNLQKQ